MATFADIISEARLLIGDTAQSRFTNDDSLLLLAKIAVERLNHLLFQHGIWFGKAKETITTVAGTSGYDVPEDMLQIDGIYRDSTHRELKNLKDDEWERTYSAAETSCWLLRGDEIFIAGTPQNAETLTLLYWPKIDTSAYETTTECPWGDRLNTLIVNYLIVRAQAIDEGSLAQELQIMQEIEQLLLSSFSSGNYSGSFVEG